jgi:phosphatidylserine decarboxylase
MSDFDDINAATKDTAGQIWQMLTSAAATVAHFFKHINAAGWPFIAIFAVISILLGFIADPLLWIGLVLTAWCVYFFRDPIRVTPDQAELVIAPADGMVSAIEQVTLPHELDDEAEEKVTRVSIFLSVFDVHVQRVPISGKIKKVVYRPGKFINASLDKASEHNERSSVLLETASGKTLAFVQIAGLIARRIINTLKEDQAVNAGERYGLIRFGSRVDVYLPEGVAPQVIVGQRMIGGETVIADLNDSTTSLRSGIAR